MVPHPSTADSQWAATRWPGTSQQTLVSGRDLYIRKCGGCHTLYTPAEVFGGDWPQNLYEMSERAKLSAGDRTTIARYIEAVGRHQAP